MKKVLPYIMHVVFCGITYIFTIIALLLAMIKIGYYNPEAALYMSNDVLKVMSRYLSKARKRNK